MIILFVFVFAGEKIIPEYYDAFDPRFAGNTIFGVGNDWMVKYSDSARTLVRSGRLYS